MNLFKNNVSLGILLIVLIYFLVKIHLILVALFIAYILMSAFKPFVEYLYKKRVPRVIGAALIYIIVFAVLVLLIIPIIPLFSSQFGSFIQDFPRYLEKVNKSFGLKVDPAQIQNYFKNNLDTLGNNAYGVASKFFGGLFTMLSIVVISFYLMISKHKIESSIVSLFSKKNEEKILTILKLSEKSLGAWLRGQLVLSLSVGLITWIALSIIGINFALPLAILAGLLEIIPTIGPIISAIPAVIIALNISPAMAIVTIIAYLIIQALENNLLVPKIMENAVGINPVLVITSILIGAELMGILGALIAIPAVSFFIIIFNTLRTQEN